MQTAVYVKNQWGGVRFVRTLSTGVHASVSHELLSLIARRAEERQARNGQGSWCRRWRRPKRRRAH